MGAEWKPFHESVVDAIRNASTSTEMHLLATLIRSTNIPKGHNEIAAAWKEGCQRVGLEDGLGVSRNLERQKREVEEKAAEKAKAAPAS